MKTTIPGDGAPIALFEASKIAIVVMKNFLFCAFDVLEQPIRGGGTFHFGHLGDGNLHHSGHALDVYNTLQSLGFFAQCHGVGFSVTFRPTAAGNVGAHRGIRGNKPP
jgi:hypothetical protein